jgi:hypothetical protein
MARYQALMRLKLSASQRVQPGDVVEIGNTAQAAGLLALGAIREADTAPPEQPPAPPAPVASEAAPAEAPARKPARPRARKAAPAAAPAPADGAPT